ncbi:hypothetical protein ANMWB30_24500 [Arthrobacter sp. MWB30]|nr:hypothetical protein ANMWB30_24500 [Arthrobacter sp. MWB30]
MTTQIKPSVTSANALITYYDLESLQNVFTVCTFTPRTNTVEVFYLVDEDDSALSKELRETGLDIRRLWATIIAKNPAYQGGPGQRPVIPWNLATLEGNERLATVLGLSDAEYVNNPDSPSIYPSKFRPVCDTDPGYDAINQHPYLAGYNSYQYDTVMSAVYFMEAFSHVGPGADFTPVRASTMRRHNDRLFSKEFRSYMPSYLTKGPVADGKGWNSVVHRIRQAMINSGRHIDVARFNESQQYVALKRLLGLQGRQILESENLGGHNARLKTMKEFMDLLAYNVSDCIGLPHLFNHPTYAGTFDLKKALLDEYPETIYEQKRGLYAPDIRPSRVRRGRLTVDSSSAKFVGIVLSPYGNLNDIETVSFMYPSEKVAKEEGIARVNVLDASRDFFFKNVQSPAARAEFMKVYDYYKSIEGKNFNDSDEYNEAYPMNQHGVSYLGTIPKAPNNLRYFRTDGSPTTCFATFSVGGIHGAEANVEAFNADTIEYLEAQLALAETKHYFPDPKALVAEAKRQAATIDLPDGTPINRKVVLLGSDPLMVRYRKRAPKTDADSDWMIAKAQEFYPKAADLLALAKPDPHLITLPNGRVVEDRKVLANTTLKNAAYREVPQKKKPELFVPKTDGANKLNSKYTFTSADHAIHEDFTSYYPNMLRNMSAFYNEDLGEDRYAKIFFDKERYGKAMKQPGISAGEKAHLNALRNGTKLILNTASGAGDTTHKTPIRMNNLIISMRIIGQLFSWRIGQAQTLAGARIVSTNTDGLYSILDEETNNRVLAEQAPLINVDIEPEPLLLVSKDSNNRLELEVPKDPTRRWDTKIISASGTSLACYEGPNPTKSLAHPAVLDHGLAHYLRLIVGGYQPQWRNAPLSLTEPFDRTMGAELLNEVLHGNDPVHAARLFQNVIAASYGSITYPFASDAWSEGEDPDEILNPRPLQHYNRMFIVKPGTPGAVNLRAAGAWVVNATSAAKRKRDGSTSVTTDPVARAILRQQGLARDRADAEKNNLTLLPADQDVTVRKISGIDPHWPVLIVNDDLYCLPQEKLQELLNCLDLDIYNQMLAESFEGNWMNWARDDMPSGVATEENSKTLAEIAA